MIKSMVNKTLVTCLIYSQFCLISSIAHSNDLFNYNTIPGGSMYTLNEEERLLLSKEDDVSFGNKLTQALETIDYFSNNYPYTVKQLENYYGIEFNVKETGGISLKPKYDSDEIFDIDIRKGAFDSQSLMINLNQNTCFNYDQLKQRLIEEGYQINPSSVYYFTNFDKVDQLEDTVISSRITISSYKNKDMGCIIYYLFEHYKIN